MGESNWSPKHSLMSKQLIGNNCFLSLFPFSRTACNNDSFFYTVLDKVVLLLANSVAFAPSPGPHVSRQMVHHFEGR